MGLIVQILIKKRLVHRRKCGMVNALEIILKKRGGGGRRMIDLRASIDTAPIVFGGVTHGDVC